MIRQLLILFCFVAISVQSSFSVVTQDDEKLRAIVSAKGEAEVIITLPGRAELDLLSRNTSIVSVHKNIVSIIISPLTIDWFLSRRYNYSIVERDETKGIATARDVKRAMEWDVYPTYTQYDSIMNSFAESWPQLCKLDTIGTSVLGRLILAENITGISKDARPKSRVFYSASIHGNETAGFILMLRLCDYLLRNYGVDPQVTRLLDTLEIWINPLANPDGAYRYGNEITNPTRSNANGYDLNRNFPDPEAPGNILQKETIGMMNFLSAHRFNLSANFHSGAEVVNYPWDRWPRDHADKAWFYQICRAYADTAHLYSPKGYMTDWDNGVTNGYAWYAVYGGRQDYVTWSLNGRETTIELDTSFVAPVSELNLLWESNRRSLIGYLENAFYGIRGTVTDSYSGNPVPAKISIIGHDKDNSEVYSDSATGNFVRFLYPGSWDLTLTADGYKDTLIQNVMVIDHESAYLSVSMEPVATPPLTTNHDIYLYPNPSAGHIRALLSDKLRDKLNIRIFSVSGLLVMNYDADASGSYYIDLDISRLAAGTYIVTVWNKSTGYKGKAKFTSAGD